MFAFGIHTNIVRSPFVVFLRYRVFFIHAFHIFFLVSTICSRNTENNWIYPHQKMKGKLEEWRQTATAMTPVLSTTNSCMWVRFLSCLNNTYNTTLGFSHFWQGLKFQHYTNNNNKFYKNMYVHTYAYTNWFPLSFRVE